MFRLGDCTDVSLKLCLQEGKLNNSRRMAAGFAAGVTEALMIVTPFEVVKIRLQQQQGMNKAALLYKVGDSRYKNRNRLATHAIVSAGCCTAISRHLMRTCGACMIGREQRMCGMMCKKMQKSCVTVINCLHGL